MTLAGIEQVEQVTKELFNEASGICVITELSISQKRLSWPERLALRGKAEDDIRNYAREDLVGVSVKGNYFNFTAEFKSADGRYRMCFSGEEETMPCLEKEIPLKIFNLTVPRLHRYNVV